VTDEFTPSLSYPLDSKGRACQDAEHLVYSLLSPWGQSIAEKLGIPAVAGLLHPLYPTHTFPVQFVPVNPGGTLNYASAGWFLRMMWLMLGPRLNRFRHAELGLPPLRPPSHLLDLFPDRGAPLLCSLSPTVIPRPSDWPAQVHMDSYWFLPTPPAWQPPPGLVEFIQRGTPPVFIGFGSMVYQNAQEVGHLVITALQKAGLRGILSIPLPGTAEFRELVKYWEPIESSSR
jgi:sterol 3beta-glucosyltransferase